MLPRLPIVKKEHKEGHLMEEEFEEMDILERALDSHAKKYETHEKELA